MLSAEPAGVGSGRALSAGGAAAHRAPASSCQYMRGCVLAQLQALGPGEPTAQVCQRDLRVPWRCLEGSTPRQKQLLPTLLSYFIKLKNTWKHLCAAIS